jgi:lipid-binding SYLF domain-containing protein
LIRADYLHQRELNRDLKSIGSAFSLVRSNLKEDKNMLKRILIVTTLVMFATVIAVASDREDDVRRTDRAAQVFKEIMNTPDHGIPSDLLERTKCIAIIPGDKKFAFIFGGSYGRGLATCHTEHGWSAPMFVAIEGGSVGYQIGGSSTDIVMLFMNDRALRSLLSDKFKLGADASVAAGPVGRQAAAGTDLKLNAEILSYSRAKGLFAGVSLDGAVVQADKSGDEAMYGRNVNRHEILDGKVAVPESARPLLHEIGRYVHEAKAGS